MVEHVYDFSALINALYSGNQAEFAKACMVPREVIYTRALIEQDLGINLDYGTVEKMMYEEGLLSAKHYDMPDWYTRKYGIK